MKKNFRMWLVLTIVVALTALAPIMILGPGCTTTDSSSSSSINNRGTITGTVTDSVTGQAMENVTVSIADDEAGLGTSSRREISDETDSEGRYILPQVLAGTQIVVAKVSGYSNLTHTVVVTAGVTTTQDFLMVQAEGGTVTGRVTNSADNSIIVNAKVYIDSVQDYSDASGDYTIYGVEPGTKVLKAEASSFQTFQATVTVALNQTLTKDIAMAEGNTPETPTDGSCNLYGRIYDNSGNPVSSVTVSAYSQDAMSVGRQDASPSPEPTQAVSPTPVATATSDENGTYTLNVDPGSYRLEYTKTGYPTQTVSATAEENSNVRINTVDIGGGSSPTPTSSPTSTGTSTSSPTSSPTSTSTMAVGAIELASKLSGTARSASAKNATVSDDATKVVFETTDGNISATPAYSSNKSQIFMWTRSTGTVSGVSLKDSTTYGNGDSNNAHIAGDGKYVVFDSAATNLVDSDTNARRDVFRVDVTASTWTIKRVSTDSTGAQIMNGNSVNPMVSKDGKYVAFRYTVTDQNASFVGNDEVDANHVYVKDAETTPGNLTWVSQKSGAAGMTDDTTDAKNWAGEPFISRDGKYIVFTSNMRDLGNAFNNVGAATNMSLKAAGGEPANYTNNRYVYRYSRTDQVTIPVSLRNTTGEPYARDNGTAGNNQCICGRPSITDDGTMVAFSSNVNFYEISQSADADTQDVYVRNTGTPKTFLGAKADPVTRGDSRRGCINYDGTRLAFDSTGKYLTGANDYRSVFVSKISGDAVSATTKVSTDSSGTEANKESQNPWITRDGKSVAFESKALNLVSPSLSGDFTSVYLKRWE